MKRGKYKPRKPSKSIKEVQKIFSREGYMVVTDHFINNSQKLECICPNKHKWTTTFTSFKWGRRCLTCSGKEKYTYDYVYDFFKQKGCLLLSSHYDHSKQKLKYRCSCGNLSTIEFRNFKQGNRCKKCSTQRALTTNRDNHKGKLYFQTDTFVRTRNKTNLRKYGFKYPMQSEAIKKKREKTNLQKYGVAHVSQCKEIQARQKSGMKEKHGVEYSLQIPSAMKKLKQTLMKKYGVPSLAYLSRPASKESQRLFWDIQKKIPNDLQEKSHFAELNREFVIKYGKEYFKYDFVNSECKKAIEYNGYNFHPKSHQKDNEKGWCAFHPDKTAKEARDYEQRKYKGLQKRGYQILTVWDKEYKKDYNSLLRKCIDFIYAK